MSDLLRKVLRIDHEKRTRDEIEQVAEGAALMQEQHARDIVSMAEAAGVGKSDLRVQRAEQVLQRLR